MKHADFKKSVIPFSEEGEDELLEEEEEEVQESSSGHDNGFERRVLGNHPHHLSSKGRTLPREPSNLSEGTNKSDQGTLQYLSQLETVARRLKNELIKEVTINIIPSQNPYI